MDEINFGNDKGPFSPGVLGVVVLAVLGATLCISKLFHIGQLWKVALLLSVIYPLYLIVFSKSASLGWIKKVQILLFGTLLIFLVGAGTNSAIINMSASINSKSAYLNRNAVVGSVDVGNEDQKQSIFKDWFSN